jgi:hypothetical protein
MTKDQAIKTGAYWASVAAMYADSLARIERQQSHDGSAAYHASVAADARAAIPAMHAAQEVTPC